MNFLILFQLFVAALEPFTSKSPGAVASIDKKKKSNIPGLWSSLSFGKFAKSGRRNYGSETAGTGEQTTEEDNVKYEENIKERILEASLPFVNAKGWTTAAISEGAVSIGYPGIIHGVFVNPNAELIDYFNRKCNQELNESFKTTLPPMEGAKNVKKFLENAIQMRLRMIIPYIEKWPQALAIMSLPTNIPIAFSTFSALIDDICYTSGDKSVDFNWYSRRAGIALIYKATELCMIQDKSPDYVETWKFLHRRTDEAFAFDKIIRYNEDAAGKMKEFTFSSITTVGNMLGFNLGSK